MALYPTTEEAHAAALERIAGRFAERPELTAAYQKLGGEEREKAKAQIYTKAREGIEVDTGRERTMQGRLTGGTVIPIRRPLERPEIERDWAALESGEIGLEDLSAEQAQDLARVAAKEEPELAGLLKTDPAYAREYMKAQANYRQWVETDMWPEDERAKGFWANAAQAFSLAVTFPNFAISQWRQRAKRVPFGNPEDLKPYEIRKRAEEAAIADMMPMVMGWETFEGGKGRTGLEKTGRFVGDMASFFLPTGKRFLFEAGMKVSARVPGQAALKGWQQRLLRYSAGGATLGAGEALMEPLPAAEADTPAGLAGRMLERGATGAVTGAALGETAYRALGGLGYAWAQTLGRDTPLMKTVQRGDAQGFANRFFRMAQRAREGQASAGERAQMEQFNAWAKKQGVDTEALARGEVGFDYRKLVPRAWTEKFPIVRGVLPDVAERVRPRATQAPREPLPGPRGEPIPKMPTRQAQPLEPLALPGEVVAARTGASSAMAGGAPATTAQAPLKPSPSPIATSEATAPAMSVVSSGDINVEAISATAQGLSKNKLRQEGVQLRKEMKTLTQRIEQGGGGADVGELQKQWNNLQTREAIYAAEQARRAQEAAQEQMFAPEEVRGMEGEKIETPRSTIDEPFSAGPYAQGGEVNRALEQARAARPEGETDFQRLALNLNEMVSLAQDLGKGKYPKIEASINRGRARGVFRASKTDPEIALQKDIFELLRPDEIAAIQENILKGMMAEAEAALSSVALESDVVKEFGADELEVFKKVVQETPALLEKYKNLEREQLDAARRAVAATREPEQALMTLAHEIGHWIDYVPDSTLKRGNVLGRIASMHKYYKQMLPKKPGEDFKGQLLTPKERAKMRAQALKDAAGDKNLAKAIYAERLNIESKGRGLVTLAEVRGELEALTTWWRLGGDSKLFNPKYHGTPEELYADAFSVLLNAPAELAARAPNFYQAFESYFSRKAAAAKSYEEMQKAIKEGSSQRAQVRKLRDALEKPEALLTARDEKIKLSERWDGLTSMVLREFQPLYRRAKRGGRDAFKRTQALVSDFLYRGTSHELYLTRLNNEIMKPLHDAGLHMGDFDEYLFHKHVVHNRFNIANPLGWTAKTSGERLKEMEADNPVQYVAMKEAQFAWWKLRQRMVIEPLRASGVFNEELIKTIEERVFYTPMRKRPTAATGDGIERLLTERYGRDLGMRIARQMGQLGAVRSPSNSLMGVDLRLMDFVKRNAAKEEVVRTMQNFDPNNYKEAETRRVQRRGRWVKEPVHVDTARIGTIYTMRNGEITGHYLPKALTVPFTKLNNINAAWYAKALYHGNTWQKAVFTQLNPGFWPVALLRDVFTRYRKMPSTKKQWYRNLLPVGLTMDTVNILRNFPSAWRSVRGTTDPLVQKAMERGLLISRKETIGHGNTYKGADIDRALIEFDKDPRNYFVKRSEAERKISKAMSFWLSIGQAFERTPKLATMRYLDEHFPDWPEWKKRNFVRQHGGSPDFLQRGTLAQAMDLVAFFWNPAREGWMSEADAATADRLGYWFRGAQTVLPSVAFKLAGLGLLGSATMGLLLLMMPWIRDEEEMKDMFRSISHYDMTNYDVIPLFWTDKALKKVLYIRIPKDETSRLIMGSMMQPALEGGNIQNIMRYTGGNTPGLNPTLNVFSDWWKYAMNGQNPYDSFLQRPVIDATEFKAGKGTEAMWQNTWNKLGGGIVKRLQTERTDFNKADKIEDFLNLPIIQNTMGRWFKVSNAGARQRLMKAPEVKEAGRKAARETLYAREIVDRIASGKELTNDQMFMLQYGTTVREKVNRYIQAAAKWSIGPEMQAIEQLQTKQEKEAAMQLIE